MTDAKENRTQAATEAAANVVALAKKNKLKEKVYVVVDKKKCYIGTVKKFLDFAFNDDDPYYARYGGPANDDCFQADEFSDLLEYKFNNPFDRVDLNGDCCFSEQRMIQKDIHIIRSAILEYIDKLLKKINNIIALVLASQNAYTNAMFFRSCYEKYFVKTLCYMLRQWKIC